MIRAYDSILLDNILIFISYSSIILPVPRYWIIAAERDHALALLANPAVPANSPYRPSGASDLASRCPFRPSVRAACRNLFGPGGAHRLRLRTSWLLHAAAALPVVLSLHAATPSHKASSGRETPPTTTAGNDPAAADPGDTPSASAVPPRDPGSSMIFFPPTKPSPPPDPMQTLAPYISTSRGGSGTPPSQSGGHPGNLPPAIAGAGGEQPIPIPEPATWLMLALPAAMLIAARSWRRLATYRRR